MNPLLTNVNNAILVHDFRNLPKARAVAGEDAQAWASRDTGPAICPQEFFTATYGGKERLFYLGQDGYCSMVEESSTGDQIQARTNASELGFAEIATLAKTRGYRHEELAPKKFPFVELALSVWDARFTVSATTGEARRVKTIVEDKEFSRSRYLKPFDRQPFDESNVNEDHAEPNRGNYSVALETDGFYPGDSGLDPEQFADVFLRYSTRTMAGQYVQFTTTNDQGRCVLKSVAPAAREGQRRMGVLL